MQRLNLAERRSAGQHYAKYILLPYSPRDRLRILRTEIEYDNFLGVHASVWQDAGWDVKNPM